MPQLHQAASSTAQKQLKEQRTISEDSSTPQQQPKEQRTIFQEDSSTKQQVVRLEVVWGNTLEGNNIGDPQFLCRGYEHIRH